MQAAEKAVTIHIANSSCSWGIDYADDPKNPPWERVFDEIVEAGYRHCELGPIGYVPRQGSALRHEFDRRGLTVEAGFIFVPLHDPDAKQFVLDQTRKTLSGIASAGATKLVTIDHVSEPRMATAGNRAKAPALDRACRDHMVALIDEIADMALDKGVTPVLHQHAGTYIEYEDEFEEMLARLEAARVAICLDTGHMAWSGMDPVAMYRRHAARTTYFHFKDIDPAVHARVLREGIHFHKAIEMKIFTPLGMGVVDWPGLAQALRETGFSGAATIEQDIDPAVSFSPKENAAASLAYLKSVGF